MLAIIPAREGSKRLPGKNTMLLNDKPLIAYSIELALQYTAITDIIVSTDSEAIANISAQYGIKVNELRPKNLATDEATTLDVLNFHINACEQKQIVHNLILLLQPTSPLRVLNDLIAAKKMLDETNANSVISYTKEQHPIAWHKFISADYSIADVFADSNKPTTTTYYPNGAIYLAKSALIKTGKIADETTKAYIMPRERSVDIDTIEDFRYAEFLLNRHS
jgi:N-acylneuraminate cytidylyltransferase/CMP-N,N'-diacetyllegionaminic acid synthase